MICLILSSPNTRNKRNKYRNHVLVTRGAKVKVVVWMMPSEYDLLSLTFRFDEFCHFTHLAENYNIFPCRKWLNVHPHCPDYSRNVARLPCLRVFFCFSWDPLVNCSPAWRLSKSTPGRIPSWKRSFVSRQCLLYSLRHVTQTLICFMPGTNRLQPMLVYLCAHVCLTVRAR